MKKLLLIFAFLLFPFDSYGQVTTITPNLGLSKPCVGGDPGCNAQGHPNWGPLVNTDFDIIDAKVPTLNLACTDGQVPTWANGKFSVCGSGSATSPSADYTWTGNHAFTKGVTINSQQVCLEDGTNCPASGSEADPVISKINGFVYSNGTTPAARSFATADANNITITNPTGSGGNPTWAVGPNVALTTRGFTATTGDWDFGSASSLTIPKAVGAAPLLDGRLATNTTDHRLKYGFNGATVTVAHLAEVQLLNSNLTALSGLTGASATIPRFTGAGAMSLLSLITCPDTGGQHYNFDGTNLICGTSGSGSLSGGTTGTLLKYASATTATNSIITEAASVVNIAGGLEVGSSPFLILDTSAIASTDKTWTVLNVSGTIRPTTGAITTDHIVTFAADGSLKDGGAAGTGTWTDSSTNTGTNKTLDESSNTLKITKSVQVELFGPTTDTASGNGAYYFRVPVSLNGTNLVGIQTNTVTAGTTGLTSVQITRCAAVATSPLCSGTTASMLTTVASIDSGETSSSTAATAAVINTSNDDVATAQILRFDVTAIHTTPAKGLIVNLDFKLP